MTRIAIVLFNLGGPDRPESVRPFLFNLFNDPAIIGAPLPIRWCLAQWISRRRAPVAQKIYQNLGGASPLLANTMAQARALEDVLAREAGGVCFKTFIAMRYWHPMSQAVAAQVKEWEADHVILLPLYPQFSTTTTGSSLKDWAAAARNAGLTCTTSSICCYPREAGFAAETARRLRPLYERARAEAIALGVTRPPRVLFSAHGLPKKIVDRGDPYQWQVERSAQAVVSALGINDLDWTVCYQSKVGPLEWIGPSTDEEIVRAGDDGVPVVVTPIAFVCEHSETLVELDIEYAGLARAHGVPVYLRTPTVDDGSLFIEGLARLVRAALERMGTTRSDSGGRICPAAFGRCAQAA